MRCAAHLDDLRLRMAPVGDDPGLRAGERDGLVAEVVDRHRAERIRDALAGRDEHVVLARVRLRRDLVREPDQLVGRACPSPRAPRRPSRPASRAATSRSRDRFSLSVSPTEVPPNFMTTSPGVRRRASTAGTASKSIVGHLRQCRQAMRGSAPGTFREWVVARLRGDRLRPAAVDASGSPSSLPPHHVDGSAGIWPGPASTSGWRCSSSQRRSRPTGGRRGSGRSRAATRHAAHRRRVVRRRCSRATRTSCVLDRARGLRRAPGGGVLLLDRPAHRALPRQGARAGR